MQASTAWWIAAGLLVVAELVTGTFYLLMLALGLVAAAVAAHLGLAPPGQFIVAALAGSAAVTLLHLRRLRALDRRPADPAAQPLDVGERVQVAAWDAQGQARVMYRGSTWTARWAGDGPPEPGEHQISAVHGAELRLQRPVSPPA